MRQRASSQFRALSLPFTVLFLFLLTHSLTHSPQVSRCLFLVLFLSLLCPSRSLARRKTICHPSVIEDGIAQRKRTGRTPTRLQSSGTEKTAKGEGQTYSLCSLESNLFVYAGAGCPKYQLFGMQQRPPTTMTQADKSPSVEAS